jgi:hypothetical protein
MEEQRKRNLRRRRKLGNSADKVGKKGSNKAGRGGDENRF